MVTKIYRGENIINGITGRIRSIQTITSRTGFPSDMINGGNPYRIEDLGITDSLVEHVAHNFHSINIANSRKHWISFSKSKSMAEHFATSYKGGNEKNEYEINDAYYTSNHDADKNRIWDSTWHLIVELDIAKKEKVEGFEGGYTLKNQECGCALLIIDVLTHLQSLPNQTADVLQAITYAEKEQEWSVLPIDLIQDGSRSAIIKECCGLNFEYYVDPDYFVR